MKVALILSGLPRKVKEGYDKYWKHVIENYDTDVYLHFWEDEEYEKVLDVYSPKKYICEKPFSFSYYTENVESPNDAMARPNKKYGIAGNYTTFPMMWGWQVSYNLMDDYQYDYIIRSRYDVGHDILLNLYLDR